MFNETWDRIELRAQSEAVAEGFTPDDGSTAHRLLIEQLGGTTQEDVDRTIEYFSALGASPEWIELAKKIIAIVFEYGDLYCE
jgi:hypothetical protein